MKQDRLGDQNAPDDETEPETLDRECSTDRTSNTFYSEVEAHGSTFGIILADLNEVVVGAATAGVVYGVKKGVDKLRNSRPHSEAPSEGAARGNAPEPGSAPPSGTKGA